MNYYLLDMEKLNLFLKKRKIKKTSLLDIFINKNDSDLQTLVFQKNICIYWITVELLQFCT